jgi:hypothetical protein
MPDEFTRSTSSRQLCRYFLKGSCRDGERCRYLHTNPDSTVRSVKLSELMSYLIHMQETPSRTSGTGRRGRNGRRQNFSSPETQATSLSEPLPIPQHV